MTQPTTDLIITRDGQPIYALIEYELYLALKDRIEAWRRSHPPLGLTGEQYQTAIAESERISAELARDPSKIVTHAELKQRLAAKRANRVAA